MNRIIKMFEGRSVLGMLLVLVAFCLGADVSMAMADAAGAIADEKGGETQLPGTAASGTQLKLGDLSDPEIDKHIAEFRPWQWPLETHMRLQAQQVTVKGYEVDHYSSATSPVEFETTGQVTNNSAKEAVVVLPVSKETRSFVAAHSTIYFPDVAAYNAAGEEDGTGLLCYVTEKTSTELKIEAINGPLNSGEVYVPDIASNSKFLLLANAMAESEMLCEPENYQPRPKRVYLQKSAVNVVMTDFWKQINKKIPFIEQDVRDDALYKFRRKRAMTMVISRMSRVKRAQGGNMGEEFVYTCEGVFHQLQNKYGLGEEMLFSDLIALTKMQFTDYSVNNEANVYCGKNFIQKLLNIDFTQYKDVEFTSNTVMGIDIRAFKTTFGTLNFIHEPVMNDLGLSDFAMVIDIKNAVRYINEAGRDMKVDMKKGAGENREATRDVHIEADCLCLRGYNSILVGPSEKILGYSGDSVTIDFTEESTLPESPKNNQIILLTADTDPWKKGDLLQYDASTQTWARYSGVIDA